MSAKQLELLGDRVDLARLHYLGNLRGDRYEDNLGAMVFGQPTSRRLPRSWVELKRWCIVGGKNAGSQQWARARAWLVERRPDCTTVVSYSDPSVGHSGALYRACGWLWAPTWHLLRPPPTGGGSWDGRTKQAPKERWVYVLRPDDARAQVLSVGDASIEARWPWAGYVEPTWRRGVPHGGGGDRRRWLASRFALSLPRLSRAVCQEAFKW